MRKRKGMWGPIAVFAVMALMALWGGVRSGDISVLDAIVAFASLAALVSAVLSWKWTLGILGGLALALALLVFRWYLVLLLVFFGIVGSMIDSLVSNSVANGVRKGLRNG